MQSTRLSIITINYNSATETQALVNSISKSFFQDWELIIVNNSIKDFELKTCKNLNISVVTPEKNLGFAGGNNFGARHAKGEYILLLNNDMEVKPTFLGEMIDLMEGQKEELAVSPKIKYFHNPNYIQFAGYNELNEKNMQCEAKGKNRLDWAAYNVFEKTPFLHGGAVMLKTESYRKTPMPEEFFLYYEELSWSKMLQDNGVKTMYCGFSEVYHKESASVGKDSPIKTYFLNRNRVLFALKHLTGAAKIQSLIYLLLAVFPIKIMFSKKYNIQRVALIKAYGHSLKLVAQSFIPKNTIHHVSTTL